MKDIYIISGVVGMTELYFLFLTRLDFIETMLFSSVLLGIAYLGFRYGKEVYSPKHEQ